MLQTTQRRLVAEQHFILKDPKILDATAVKMVKLLAWQARLTKHIHLGSTPAATAPAPDEEEGKAEGPLESMLRKISKGTTRDTSHTSHLGKRVNHFERNEHG